VIDSFVVHHLIVVVLNFPVDSDYCVYHLVIGSDFVHHLMVAGLNFVK
jgi:hypothetical protein